MLRLARSQEKEIDRGYCESQCENNRDEAHHAGSRFSVGTFHRLGLIFRWLGYGIPYAFLGILRELLAVLIGVFTRAFRIAALVASADI
jgi:hypothetical protein